MLPIPQPGRWCPSVRALLASGDRNAPGWGVTIQPVTSLFSLSVLTGSHGANCAWQVYQCITAHSTDSGSHPCLPVSTTLLYASLPFLQACPALWMFAFYTIEGLALTLVFSSCGPLLSTFILVTFGLINQEMGGGKAPLPRKSRMVWTITSRSENQINLIVQTQARSSVRQWRHGCCANLCCALDYWWSSFGGDVSLHFVNCAASLPFH